MAGPGTGIHISRRRPQSLVSVQGTSDAMPQLSPSASWDGTAGSGFASIPVDPERTSAKSAARLLMPDHQFFTDRLEVGVMALANNSGTLIGGVTAVIFRFEGGSTSVASPSYRTRTRYDGSTYQCLGYWCELVKPAGTSGHANLYIEVVPADASMQSRVLGPYQFSPQDTLYAHDLTVTPSQPRVAGVNHQTVGDALKYLAGQDSENARITVTETQTEDLNQTAQSGVAHNPQGRCLIRATAPVTFAGSQYRGDSGSNIAFKYRGVHFQGPNITFDMQHINNIISSGNNEIVMERVRFTNSGGRGALWRGGPRFSGQMVDGETFFLECYFHQVSSITKDAQLVLGCDSLETSDDWGNSVSCLYYNRIVDHDSNAAYLNELNSATIRYTGSEATGTIEITGQTNQPREFILRWGANTATFNITDDEAGYNAASAGGFDPVAAGSGYFISDLVDWVNAQTDWTATLLDDARKAAGVSLSGEKVSAIPETDAKSAALTLITIFDIHADFYQQNFSGTAPVENRIVAFNTGREWVGQVFHVAGSAEARDLVIVGNAFQMKRLDDGYYSYLVANSNFTRHPFSHVCLVHNTIDAQELKLGTDTGFDPDSYVMIANNSLRAIKWSGPSDADVTIIDNAVDAGATVPSRATGTIVGGSPDTKFVDWANGNLAPASDGELAANLKPLRMPVPSAQPGTLAPVGARSL